jgi:hypothetical protein
MNSVIVNGHEIEIQMTKSAYDRKAVQYANSIITELKKLNIQRDDIEINTNILGNKIFPATLEFWFKGYYLRFSYSIARRFIDNLYVIKEFIKIEVNEVLTGKKEFSEFIQFFSTDSKRKDIGKELKNAKVKLGLNEYENDIIIINKAYKKLAKTHHPDIGGNLEEFKNINKAHKLIKKEMGFL